MKSGTLSSMLSIALVALAVTATADEKTIASNSARFEALKKLAGEWVELGKDGKPTDTVLSSFRITAGGSVIEETNFPGSGHEMVTMYHLDGPDLVLTHYCILGNQPRMRAEPSAEASRLVFKFVSGTNLKSADENHMDQATITILSNDHVQTEWVSCMDGKPCHKASFDMARKQK